MARTANPDAAGDGADGAQWVRRSGAWNHHASAALAAFMEASRASGYGKVVMKYGGLQCQAFVPGQEEPQPDPWSKIQQARIDAMHCRRSWHGVRPRFEQHTRREGACAQKGAGQPQKG